MNDHAKKNISAFTTIELIVAMAIFSLAISGIYGILQLTAGASKSSLKNKLEVQKDSRRAHMKLVDEITCAAEIVKPEIGTSAPFLVLVNKDGLICVYFLKEADFTFDDKTVIKGYKLYCVTKNPTTQKVESEREIMTHIKRLVFTATSEGSAVISLRMFNKNEEFDLITQVTLKNYYAGELIY